MAPGRVTADGVRRIRAAVEWFEGQPRNPSQRSAQPLARTPIVHIVRVTDTTTTDGLYPGVIVFGTVDDQTETDDTQDCWLWPLNGETLTEQNYLCRLEGILSDDGLAVFRPAAGGGSSSIRPLFTQTQNVTVANTTTDTTIVGTGEGSLTLPADFFTVGKRVRCTLAGYLSATNGTPTITVSMILDVQQTGIAALGVKIPSSGNAWWAVGEWVCRSTGATGTIQQVGQGWLAGDSGATGNCATGGSALASPLTFDTTASMDLDFKLQWNAAHANSTATCKHITVEAINPP